MRLLRQGLLTYIALTPFALTLGAHAASLRQNALRLQSHAFKNGGAIPIRYTCLGQNISPPLAWRGVPATAKSLALIMDDPDAPAGTWAHWVIYGLSAKAAALPEGGKPKAHQGRNSFGNIGYGGPCPPRGPAHHYYFQLYALDSGFKVSPEAPSTVDRTDILSLMRGHILARAQMIGTFTRP